MEGTTDGGKETRTRDDLIESGQSLEQRALLADEPSSQGPSVSWYDDGREGRLGRKDVPLWEKPIFIIALKNLGLILLWYFFGTFLSMWNKLLLGKEHGLFGRGAFPAPFFMSAMQFLFQHLIARFVIFLGASNRRSAPQARLTWKEYAKTVVPNGIATGLDIGFSNFSLVFITLSFYVMCKSTTPLFLLTFAIAWGIEK